MEGVGEESLSRDGGGGDVGVLHWAFPFNKQIPPIEEQIVK